MKSFLNQKLNHLSIPNKIALIFIPPLVIIGIGLLFVIAANIGKINAAQNIERTVELALLLDRVAHNHAVERGLTAGFLGSKGALGEDSLKQQRAKADAAQRTLLDWLTTESPTLSNAIQAQITSLQAQLKTVKSLRSQVDVLNASGNPFKVYSNINKTSLDAIYLLNENIHDPRVKQKTGKLLNLLWLKERAGQERGALNGVFASGHVNKQKLLDINGYISDQDAKIDTLKLSLSELEVSELDTALTDENSKTVDAFRSGFLAAVNHGEPVPEDASTWFSVSTQRIKNIKKLADNTSTQVLTIAHAAATSAWVNLSLALVASFIGTFLLFTFSQLVSGQLRLNINKLVNTLKHITVSKNFSTRVELDTHDELSNAATATNALLEELQCAIDSVTEVMSSVAKGDFHARIETQFTGDLDKLKHGVNHSAERVQKTMDALSEIMDALEQGDFSKRMTNKVEGEFKAKVDSAMITLDNALSSVGDTVYQMSEGDFSQRIELNLNGSLAKLKTNINNALDGVDGAMQDISNAVSAQQQGDFSWRIENNYHGDLAALKNTMNNSMQSIDYALQDISNIFKYIQAGDYNHQLNRPMSGDLNTMKSLINTSIIELNTAITEIANVANEQMQGNLSAQISGRYEGQLATLKNTLNQSGETLNNAVSAISSVMKNVKDGDFSQRIDVPMLGIFDNLKTSVNRSLDALQLAVKELNENAKAQQDGKLYQSIEGNHAGDLATIKHAVNASLNNMVHIIREVQASSQNTLVMSSEQSIATNEMSRRTEAQAAALEQIASTMEHIASTASETETSCTSMHEQISHAIGVSNDSSKVVDDTVSSMNGMRDSSQRIASITTMIDEIAFQTNLLALNAAVEAARAGEQGRGFAVVASEVRTLAQRSADAAKSIKNLIEDNVQKVDDSYTLAQKSKQGLEKITDAIRHTLDHTKKVGEAASAQNQSVQEVNSAITSLDRMTQENAAMVEQTNAATRTLEEQSELMNNKLNFFVLSKP